MLIINKQMGKSKKYNNKYTKDKNVNEDGIKIKQINKKKQNKDNNKVRYEDYIEDDIIDSELQINENDKEYLNEY